MTDIVIVGAGHCGLRAALAARATGFEGDITLVDSDEQALPYERPSLSKWPHGELRTVPIAPGMLIESARLTFLKDQAIRIHRDKRQLDLAGGSTLPYKKLLLATGARARLLASRPDALTLRSRADAVAVRARALRSRYAVIVGAGFLGLELAASLRALDVDVHVIEQARRILGRGTTTAVARIVQGLHEKRGVRFSLHHSGDIPEADLIVAGVGSLPNTELASEAGLTVENGIVTDEHLRTSDPHVFAAGDCCTAPVLGQGHPRARLEAWNPAGQQGRIAGENMVSETLRTCRLTPHVWSEQYQHVLQSAGLPVPNPVIVERSYASDHRVSFLLDRVGRLTFAVGVARGAKIAKDIRFAKKLIEAGSAPEPAALADPGVALTELRT